MPDVEDSRRASSLYRKIEVRMWGDERFRRLSPLAPSGQALWIYLLTGPHTGPIPGLFKAGRAAMAEELGWEPKAFDEAFGEAFREGMVKADFQARLVWLPNAVKVNPPASPNVVTSWRSAFDLLPECDLKREAMEGLRASVLNVGEAYGKAFDKAFGMPSGKPSPKTCPNQEQDKEQEKKEKKDAAPPLRGVAAPDHVHEPPPSVASPQNGASLPPGKAGVGVAIDDAVKRADAEAMLVDPDSSAEDRFYALKFRAADKGVSWSRAMQLAKLHQQAGDGFEHSLAALEKALRARDPSTYLGKVVSEVRSLVDPPQSKPGGKRSKDPPWVCGRREEGFDIRPDGPNRWIDCGQIFDDTGDLIGF